MNNEDFELIQKEIDLQSGYEMVKQDSKGRDVFKYTYNGVQYYLEKAWTWLADEKGLTSQVELLGYNRLIGYEGEADQIDLSWMSFDDRIFLTPNNGLKKITVNSSNIRNMIIFNKDFITLDFDIILNPSTKDFLNLKTFINNSKSIIGKINFNSDNEMFNYLVSRYLSLYGITPSFSLNESESKTI